MKTPYYAVIFTSLLKNTPDGYQEMSAVIEQMVKEAPGFIGMDYARSEIGITICYWKDLESIELWKNNSTHRKAQQLGKQHWYQNYRIRVCKVEKDYASF